MLCLQIVQYRDFGCWRNLTRVISSVTAYTDFFLNFIHARSCENCLCIHFNNVYPYWHICQKVARKPHYKVIEEFNVIFFFSVGKGPAFRNWRAMELQFGKSTLFIIWHKTSIIKLPILHTCFFFITTKVTFESKLSSG